MARNTQCALLSHHFKVGGVYCSHPYLHFKTLLVHIINLLFFYCNIFCQKMFDEYSVQSFLKGTCWQNYTDHLLSVFKRDKYKYFLLVFFELLRFFLLLTKTPSSYPKFILSKIIFNFLFTPNWLIAYKIKDN
jgi:hypothetical protein